MAAKKKSWNDKTRNQKIMLGFFGGIIAFIGGIWIYSATGSDQKEGAVQISKAQNSNRQKTDHDAAYVQQLSKVNKAQAEKALQSGDSWISIPAYYTETKPTVEENSVRTKPRTRLKEQQVQPVVRKGAKPAAAARKEAAEILKSMQVAWSYAPPVDADVSDVNDYAAMFAPAVVTNTSLNAAAPKVNPTVAPYKLYEAFDLCSAKLRTALNTDTNSAVRASLMCKELYGARLYAPGYKLVGEDIDMTFTMMVYKKKTYAIQAKPVDLDTGRSMLTGDVNHRYVRRILIPAIALGVQKAGSLYENQSDDTTYVSNGTVVTQNSSKVDPNQVWGTFVGGIAEQTANVLKADNARIPPIQVSRPDNPTFGVMFIKPVLSTDVIDSEKTVTAPTEQPYSMPAAQQQADTQRVLQSYSDNPSAGQNQFQQGPIFTATPMQ